MGKFRNAPPHIYSLFIFGCKAARAAGWISTAAEGILGSIFSQDCLRIFYSYLESPPHVSQLLPLCLTEVVVAGGHLADSTGITQKELKEHARFHNTFFH